MSDRGRGRGGGQHQGRGRVRGRGRGRGHFATASATPTCPGKPIGGRTSEHEAVGSSSSASRPSLEGAQIAVSEYGTRARRRGEEEVCDKSERMGRCEAAAKGISELSLSCSPTSPLTGQALQRSQLSVPRTEPALGAVTGQAKASSCPVEGANPPTVSPSQPATSASTQAVEKRSGSGFRPPDRPGFGSVGRLIALRANRFKVSLSDKPTLAVIYHYDVKFSPELKPQRIGNDVIEEWVKKYARKLGGLRPVFDGKANLYVSRQLPEEEASYDVSFKIREDEKETNYTVTVKYAAAIPVQKLKDALAGRIQSCPQEVIQALDIIMRMTARVTLTTIGRSVFGSGPRESLGQGREMWIGYYQTVRPNLWGVDLTVDVSATAFYEERFIDEYLCEVMGWSGIRGSLSPRDRERFLVEIKGVRVVATHLPYFRKFTVCDVTKEPADKLSFDLDQEGGGSIKCTVARYFQDKYNRRLKYPSLPCLQVAPKEKKRFFPMEVCRIAPKQRCLKKLPEKLVAAMIKKTARPPAERQAQIMNFVSDANFNRDPYISQFGITVDIKMCELKGRVLPPPQLQYGGNRNLVTPRDGVWDMRGNLFLEGKRVTNWALLCFVSGGGRGGERGGGRGGRGRSGYGGGGGREGIHQCCCYTLSSQLQRISKDHAMPVVQDPVFHQHADNERQLESLFRVMKQECPNIELVVAILPQQQYNCKDIYSELKRLGDLEHEIPSQCVVDKIAKDSKPQVLSNLCLKINAKLGGINVAVPKISRCPTFKPDEAVIFFGADVTHPSPGTARDESMPSIAAVVGSIDNKACKYACQVRSQASKKEIITELQGMVRELLVEYFKRTNLKPTRVIFYRDGVSEGQFSEVLVEELRAIQRACSSLEVNYRPGITMVVVQKRHHTRFFPVDKRDGVGKSGNIPPGTVVDRVVVHPIQFDFFLCSHQGIQGTSRPTYYHVLWDDNNFTADDLQMLTYQLCHVYVRCTRSVSLPAPVYYAHLAAYRARCYPRMSHPASSSASPRKYSTMKMMYFT
ncbi:protein argonaute-2-like [Corticium candelabrum]|uniref:protein argonaute-2-like n=1 Tax=Corticium candelabrum TaxID=121492 RepID=UPI002E324D3F|nr:protein argonaute-2-like [Corticium candelabrum]